MIKILILYIQNAILNATTGDFTEFNLQKLPSMLAIFSAFFIKTYLWFTPILHYSLYHYSMHAD